MKPIDKYVPEKWVGEPDMYHHDKYGEHVSTWDVIL